MNQELLFHQALAKPSGDRAGFLETACAGDPELRAAVEALLTAHEASGGFVDRPPPAVGATAEHTPDPAVSAFAPSISATAEYLGRPADTFIAGRYTLEQKLGEGGMGEVWVAKQTEPVKRKVALKLIKPGMDSRAVLQRFEQERQALALMDHPNVAKVLDAGSTPAGQPFFAMELVNGAPLTKFCDEMKLTPEERLGLFVPICHAVQHAHQKGIIHRDLKPANILITLVDGKPVPKVIDFGVAKATAGKLTDESLSTQFGAIVGTLEYMSPEQAGFSGEDVDTRADIYSLGVILYELLTGLRPIDVKRLRKAALTEMIRIIREEEPSKPSARPSTDDALLSIAALCQVEPRRLMTMLRGELDWVVMKCLEKQRDRRYEAASGLARDIQRYLADEPVEARPPSAGYRLRKFVSRHKGQVIAASLVLLALLGGIAGATWGLLRARAAATSERLAKDDALKQKARAEDRERQAIGAVRRFRDAVVQNPTLKNSLPLEGLRKSLLNEPLAFFRSLRKELEADGDTRPESLTRLARAGIELGDLTAEIGDRQDAITAYREALAILQRLAAEHPTISQDRVDAADGYGNLGRELQETSATAEARRSLEAGLAIVQKLAAEHPGDPKFQGRIARFHASLGDPQLNPGALGEARRSYEAAVKIGEQLVAEHPDVPQYQQSLAKAYSGLSRLWIRAGQLAEARRLTESNLAVYRKLAAGDPAVSVYQVDLAQGHNDLGLLLTDLGATDEARRSYEAALRIQERLVADNPTVTKYQCHLAVNHGNLANLFHRAGAPAEARRSCEAALKIYQKLAADNPTVTVNQVLLANGHGTLANVLRDSGARAEARTEYKAALAIRRRLIKEHPESSDFVNALGGGLSDLAGLEILENHLERARDLLHEAVACERKALAVYPRHPVYRQFLANHLRLLAHLCPMLHDPKGAAEAQRELAELRGDDPQLAALDKRLVAVGRGEPVKDQAERLALIQRAYDTRKYALGARLSARALEADPTMAADRRSELRYNAACFAALASAGAGTDEPAPDPDEKAKLRAQARKWLEAELETWAKLLQGPSGAQRSEIAAQLNHWRNVDADLAGIRDEKELADLPESDRKEWAAFWARVEALRAQASGPTSGAKP
jgi:serine/threonine protein kinase/tetratricopeptide (TPR) repeat protein